MGFCELDEFYCRPWLQGRYAKQVLSPPSSGSVAGALETLQCSIELQLFLKALTSDEKGQHTFGASELVIWDLGRGVGETLDALILEEPPAPATANNEQVQGRGEGKDGWWDALPPAFEKADGGTAFVEVAATAPPVL